MLITLPHISSSRSAQNIAASKANWLPKMHVSAALESAIPSRFASFYAFQYKFL